MKYKIESGNFNSKELEYIEFEYSDLMPCPFCLYEHGPDYDIKRINDDNVAIVLCHGCSASIVGRDSPTYNVEHHLVKELKNAIDKWNTRVYSKNNNE